MSQISYSSEAHGVLHYFYHSNYLLYVEGQDDLLFWNKIFIGAGISGVQIEELGGRIALDDKEQFLLKNNSNFFIARDRDHVFFSREPIIHPRILYTYGYSIENTLYCTANINRFMQNIYKTLLDQTDEIENYIRKTENDLLQLLIFDIYNHKFSKSINIFGDTCHRFTNTDKDYYIDSDKVNSFLASIKDSFDIKEVEKIKDQINAEHKPIIYLIKGHFLTLLFMNYIRFYLSKKNDKKSLPMSCEFFFSTLIDGCFLCGNKRNTCRDFQYLIEQARTAIGSEA